MGGDDGGEKGGEGGDDDGEDSHNGIGRMIMIIMTMMIRSS